MTIPSWNRLEVDLAALRHNFRRVRQGLCGTTEVLAVVKADAYGHGLIAAARTFANAGAGYFGVAELEEGIRLRQAGIAGQILVLLGIDHQGAAEAVANRLSPVVYDLKTAAALAKEAKRHGQRLGIQVKVDVGMSRLGLLPDDFFRFLDGLAQYPELYLAGIMTHLPKADIEGDALSQEQHQLFQRILAELPTATTVDCIKHLSNSAALLRSSEMHYDMVRPGITLYGCSPSEWLTRAGTLDLRPAMRFQTRVIQIKELPAGQGISYGHRYQTTRPTRLAVLPVGYADGYLRRLTGSAEVLLGGKRAPIRGMICMNACMADVTEIPSVRPGDEAVLLGQQGEEQIGADEIAKWSSTISYEILSLFGACNQQVWVDSAAS